MTAERRWRPTNLLQVPHRLGFFLALAMLVATGAWWSLVQLDRAMGFPGLPYVLSPSLVHGAAMTFGYFPLFFAGFLFTAGPKWLGIPGPEATQLAWPLGLQVAGWWLWLTGSHWSRTVSLLGLALAELGLSWTCCAFWALIRCSKADDKLHARSAGFAFAIGCLGIAGLGLSLALDANGAGLACVLTGLWGFVLLVFVSTAHRMLPFFTSQAMPFIQSQRPFWALGLMQSVIGFEVFAAWVDALLPLPDRIAAVWSLLRGTLEVLSGCMVLWLSAAWGRMQSLRNRLLAMLHTGYMWLGLALLLGGTTQFAGWAAGYPMLGLGQVHALAMGCMGSLMLAMVSRVASAHHRRAVVVDSLVWTVFLALQCATVMRIAATLPNPLGPWLVPSVAILWFALFAPWSLRLMHWFGSDLQQLSKGRPIYEHRQL